jgi:cation transport regulator ChaB
MPDDGTAITEWRRSLATEAFNHAWDLIDKTERTPDEEREMIVLAAASRYLWEAVGGDEQLMVGDWQIAHVLSLLGDGSQAVGFATEALRRTEANGWGDWRLASALEGVARAHAARGDAAQRDRYAAMCRAALAGIEDAEERDLIASQLTSVPGIQ